MHAVIKTGGKQYRVKPGDTLNVEKLEISAGEEVRFDHVLLISDESGVKIGSPNLLGAQVIGHVLEHGRAKKIRIIHFKRRKGHLKRQGHRQSFTKVQITEIAAA
jgi:large subunit ribosomal protein L21